ncbi:MAG: DNA repair protein RecO [Lachnospiraceae bacterium]|nr:DNA repair protein RecO [Lachnospiraceae bacterium]
MQDFLSITGMVMKVEPIGEYDRRIVILTKERGKISAFAKGARKPNSSLVAATNPFSFGEFKLYVGKTSYNIIEANISNYFEELRRDFEGAYYGMYFLEIADYYTRENNDEREMLRLLYQSFRALLLPSLSNDLIRYIYEIKAIVVNGEFPGMSTDKGYLDSTAYAVDFIMNARIEHLYTFTVTEEVLSELKEIATGYRTKLWDKKFKSLEIIEQVRYNNRHV